MTNTEENERNRETEKGSRHCDVVTDRVSSVASRHSARPWAPWASKGLRRLRRPSKATCSVMLRMLEWLECRGRPKSGACRSCGGCRCSRHLFETRIAACPARNSWDAPRSCQDCLGRQHEENFEKSFQAKPRALSLSSPFEGGSPTIAQRRDYEVLDFGGQQWSCWCT